MFTYYHFFGDSPRPYFKKYIPYNYTHAYTIQIYMHTQTTTNVHSHLRNRVTFLTCISCFHMILSKGSDALNFSMTGSVEPLNLPPQSFTLSFSEPIVSNIQ